MKVSSAELSPILRSDAQGRMLALLFANPDDEFTMTDLAEQTGISLPSVTRDISRLARAGYLVDRRVGRSRLVRANRDHALYAPLRALVLYGYGPAVLIPDVLRALTGIESAFIFGSWAARYQGESGADPNDIDLLVIGDPERADVFNALAPIERDLRRPVNVTFLSPDRWRDGSDGFVRTVRERALVQLL